MGAATINKSSTKAAAATPNTAPKARAVGVGAGVQASGGRLARMLGARSGWGGRPGTWAAAVNT